MLIVDYNAHSLEIFAMYLVYDLGAFLLMIAVAVPRSVVRLRNRPPMPLELQLRSLSDAELTEQQRSFFSAFDKKLDALGFHPFCTYTGTNTSGKGLSRNYVNPSDPANCTVLVVEVETVVNGVRKFGQASSVQFLTKFPDDRRCVTSNSGQMKLFDVPPAWRVQRCRNITDLAELKRRHDQLAAGMGLPLPAIADVPALLESVRERHRVSFDHQVRSGLYVLDPGGTTLRPTDRFYWRAIRRHYNPFTHAFRFDSFLPAALLGTGLPLLASLEAVPLSTRIASYVTLPEQVLPTLLATIGVLLGGAAAGWFLQRQTILWTFLFIFLPLCLLGRTAPAPLFVFIAAVLAHYVHQFRVRRRLMLIEDSSPV